MLRRISKVFPQKRLPIFETWQKRRLFNNTLFSPLSVMEQPSIKTSLSAIQERLTYPQLQIFLCSQKYPNSMINHNTFFFQLKNREKVLDPKKLKNAILSATLSCDALRTSFQKENSKYVQCRFNIDRQFFPIDHMWEYFDCSNGSSAMQEAEVNRLFNEKKNRPIDITKWPLIKFTCIKKSYDTHVLIAHAHHIILDGPGMASLLNKIADYYNNEEEANIITPILDSSYEKYCKQYNYENYIDSDDIDAKQYWQKRLANSKFLFDAANVNTIQLFPRPVSVENDKMDAENILKRIKQQDVSRFEFMSAAYIALLRHYTGQSDICIGYPSTLRDQSSRNLVAHSLNTLPLRVPFSKSWTFSELVQAVKVIRQEDKKYIHYPAEMINCIGGHASNFHNVSVISASLKLPFPLAGLEVISHNPVPGISEEMDILSFFYDIHENQSLTLSLLYQHEILNQDFVIRFLGNLKNLINIVSKNPDIPLSDIHFMGDEEKNALLTQFSGVNYLVSRKNQTVYDAFYEKATVSPHQLALIFGDIKLTYQELSDKVDEYAIKFSQLGIASGDCVVFSMARSAERIAVMLAIMKIKAVFVPIELDETERKWKLIIEDVKPKLIITDEYYQNYLASTPLNQADHELSHIMYTSGTTGDPKGIMITSPAFADRVGSLSDVYQITQQDIVLQICSASFDAWLEEVFITLTQGAVLAIAPPNAHQEMRLLVEYIRNKRVTVLDMVPSLLQVLTEYMIENHIELPSVTCVISGGEKLSNTLAKNIYQCFPNSKLLNTYGPSETNIVCTHTEVQRNSLESIPIGSPIPNTTAYVLSENGELVPWGSKGQLCIGGPGIAEGYLHKPLLTQEQFIDNPFGSGRLYKTGDIAYYNEEGLLVFCGRSNDHQIKISGKRIELGEINSILESSGLLFQCVTVMKKEGKFKEKLVAYVTFKQPEKREDAIKKLDDFSKQALPSHIKIGGYILDCKLPRLTSGKIDISQLSHCDDTEYVHTVKHTAKKECFVPQDKLMKSLFALVAEILEKPISDIETDISFYDLGGSSFDAIKLLSKIDTQFHISLPIAILLEHGTIEALYQLIKQKKGEPIHYSSTGLVKVRDTESKETGYTLFLHSGYGIINKEMQLNACLTGAIYAFDNPYFGAKRSPFKSIHDMADHYFEIIQNESLLPPDRIIGWSLGGVLAIEIATLFHQKKNYKPDVILLDSYNWGMINKFYKENRLSNPLTSDYNIDYLIGQFGKTAADSSIIQQLKNEIEHALKLLGNYTPGFYHGRVALLQAAKLSQDLLQLDARLRNLLAADNGWKDIVDPNQFQILSVPGDHYTLLSAEHLSDLVEVFKISVKPVRNKPTNIDSVFSMFSPLQQRPNKDNSENFFSPTLNYSI